MVINKDNINHILIKLIFKKYKSLLENIYIDGCKLNITLNSALILQGVQLKFVKNKKIVKYLKL